MTKLIKMGRIYILKKKLKNQKMKILKILSQVMDLWLFCPKMDYYMFWNTIIN